MRGGFSIFILLSIAPYFVINAKHVSRFALPKRYGLKAPKSRLMPVNVIHADYALPTALCFRYQKP